jgi:hypothetical protein
MLCASWELYAESLLVESLRHLCSKCESPHQLPFVVQKELAKHVRESKHELKPLALANSGWCDVVISHAEQQCASLNTPKAGPINNLFHKFIGLERVSDAWACGASTLNEFVGVRGEIAHRGRDARYVPLWKLRDHLVLIDAVAKETDNVVREHLKSITGGRQPWQIVA